MKCEEVRELLPAYVDRELHLAGEVEIHLASCADCSAELASYRKLAADLAALRDGREDPPAELVQRAIALIPPPSIGARVIGSFQSHPVLYAVASVGGVAVGATAIALFWSRVRRATDAAG